MKKHVLASAILAALAASAHAQVSIYGALDIGLIKSTDATLKLGRGDNNKLGFRGTEDLGGGMTASFRLEQRFEPDTGQLENNGKRALFQGRSWVGLSGAFGTLRLGRDLTPLQDQMWDYDPFQIASVGTLYAATLGNYSSDPYRIGTSNGASAAGNRFANGIYYSSPQMRGFELVAAVASKEAGGTAPGDLPVNPLSLVLNYRAGALQTSLGYERNARAEHVWAAAGAYQFGIARLTASRSRHNSASSAEQNWSVGAELAVSANGTVRAGYGHTAPERGASARQVSLGYWHQLSKRSFIYTDLSTMQDRDGVYALSQGQTNRSLDVGLRHTF